MNQQVRRQDEEGKTTRCHHGTPFIATMLPSAPPLSYCRRRHAIVKMLHPPRRHLTFPSFHCNYCCIFSSPPRCTELNTLNTESAHFRMIVGHGQPHHSMNEHRASCNTHSHRVQRSKDSRRIGFPTTQGGINAVDTDTCYD